MARGGRAEPVRSPALVDGAGQVLDLIRTGRAQTTSSLAATMGMARSTVLQRLEFLTAYDLVASETTANGGRGRPAAIYAFEPRSAIVLAAHVGFTGCRLAVADLDGAVLAQHFLGVDLATGPDGLLAGLEESFDHLISAAGVEHCRVAGVGVGVPRSLELLSYLHSLGLSGKDWDRSHFHQALLARYRAPVFIDTDVNLLALAERRKSWPDAEVFVCAKLGTLIDAALVVNGVPIRGASWLAGELGHIKISGSAEPCTCGSAGCLDAVASGSALVRRLASAGFDVHHVSQVVQWAEDGVPEAVRALRDAGRYIGEALASVVNLLNPDAVAVWGYLAEAEALLFSGIREGLYSGALPGSSEPLTLVSATLGDLAGVLGAAMLVIDEVLSPASIDKMIVDGSWAPSGTPVTEGS
ncbi:MAG: ROK family protein [Streptosporangiales bacterium]